MVGSLPPLLPARVAVFFHFMLEGYFNALWSVYLPRQQLELGLSDSLVGAASLFNYGGQVVATLIAALLLQRIGARASCLTGALLFCCSMFFIPLSHSFATLSITFLLFGSTEGIMDVSMNACAVLTETVAARPLLGTYHGSYSVAAALGGLIGGAFVDQKWDEQSTYSVSASVGICLALLSFLQLYSLEQEQLIAVEAPASPLSRTRSYSSVADVEKARVTDQDNHLLLETHPLQSSSSTLLNFLIHRPLFVLSFVGFLASFGEGAVVTWVTIWFTRIFSSAPGGLYSLGFTSFMSCMALGRFACDYLRQIVGRRQMVTVSGLLASGGVTLVAFAPSMVAEPASVYVACLGCAVTGLGLSTLIPTVFSSAGHLPGEHAGTAISRVAFWTYAGSIVSPPLIGALSDAFQSLQLGFIMLAVLLFLLFFLGRLVPPDFATASASSSAAPPSSAGMNEGANLRTPLLVKSDEPSIATGKATAFSGGSTWSGIALLFSLFASSPRASESQQAGMRIALHAQVAPSANKIVGSVITTDGMRAALSARPDVSEVRVFYPFTYSGFVEQPWDLVLIEGWFPMIDEFIQIARSHSPDAVVLFFCLDPIYPGMEFITKFDVDGFLTNSRSVAKQLEVVAPTEYVLLAADPEAMRPHEATPAAKKQGTVYVGAGGNMMTLKPLMVAALKAAAASPQGLALYGAGWDESGDEQILSSWRGVLPRGNLSLAYSNARVVLALTVEAQRREGMVNNRVFEAMSCGALLLSDASEGTLEVAEGAVEFFSSANEASAQLKRLLGEPEAKAEERGRRARDLVLRKHTWAHRAVDILSFYFHVRRLRDSQRQCCSRTNCPRLLWLASAAAERDSDYGAMAGGALRRELCRHYHISPVSLQDFADSVEEILKASSFAQERLAWLLSFDVLWASARPLDPLDALLRRLAAAMGRRRDLGTKRRLQKWALFVVDTAALPDGAADSAAAGAAGVVEAFWQQHVDLLVFRDVYDQRRLQEWAHAVGAGADLCAYARHSAARCDVLFGLEVAPSYSLSSSSSDGAGTGADAGAGAGAGAEGRGSGLWSDKEFEARDPEAEEDVDTHPPLPPAPPLPKDVVVCFYAFAHLCSQRARRRALDALVPFEPSDEGSFALLLVGGAWGQWLELGEHATDEGETVVPYPLLPLVSHVGHDRPTDWAHALVRQAQRVFLLAPGDGPGLNQGLGQGPSCPIWPFVLAALSGARMFMPSPNAHLLLLAGEAADTWGSAHLDRGVRTLVSKLHGLGSASSRVVATTLATAQSESPMQLARACAATSARNVTALIGLQLESFQLGRDGQCCFFYSGRRLHCLIRLDEPFVAVRVEVTPEQDPACSPLAQGTAELEIKLRGNLFADFVHNTSVLVPLSRAAFRAEHLTTEEQIRFDRIAANEDLKPFVSLTLPAR